MADYKAFLERPTIVQGDTMDGFKVTAKDQSTDQALVPSSVCIQMRDRFGKLIHTFDFTLSQDGGIIVHPVSAEETASWPVGQHKYAVRFRFQSGRVRTYLEATLSVEARTARC